MSFKITCSAALPLFIIITPIVLFLCYMWFLIYIGIYGWNPLLIYWSAPFLIFFFILYAFWRDYLSFFKTKNKKRN